MISKRIPVKIGRIYQGKDSYGIKAEGYSIFGFGKTPGDAHIHFLQACYAYMRHAPLDEGTPFSQTDHEEQLLLV